jgi:nitrate reductase NapE component
MVVAVLPLAILGGFGWLVWKLITSLFGSEDE